MKHNFNTNIINKYRIIHNNNNNNNLHILRIKPYSTSAKLKGRYHNHTHYYDWRGVPVNITKLEPCVSSDINVRCVKLHEIGKFQSIIHKLRTDPGYAATHADLAQLIKDLEGNIQIRAKDFYAELHLEDAGEHTKVLNAVLKIFSNYRSNRELFEKHLLDNTQPSSELSQALISNSSDTKQFIDAFERAKQTLDPSSARSIILQECNEKLTKTIGYPAHCVAEYDRSLFFSYDLPYFFDLSTLYALSSLIISFVV